MSSIYPIGVFDSGVGGLSVLRDIRKELSNEDLLYVADSSHAPYGDKESEYIEARSIAISQFLVDQPVKAIVVACNTATGAAVAKLRTRFSVPIIAMEPAVKPAVEKTKTGVVGVLATRRTVSSENFINLLTRFGANADIVVQPCPGLVEQVEAGDLLGEKTRTLLEPFVLPLLERGVDTIVLGCTHYPFLAPLIRAMVGIDVDIIDPGEAIARELRRRLENIGRLSRRDRLGTEQFWTSGSPKSAKKLISQLWETEVEVMRLPE
ncbi:MAG: glutamate racemase [Candidatus Methylumidiphilus alinenensis]|uniref:Glutamate racemase n=1 Tax=Candidatus Methylumidiphilus alinenensis TaxID=2202197 RepID=A0A2W4R8C6_9GAMM|nr:MAG: glutamate racemase [Candidatus Methylumidiphilus alinenensis]